MQAVGVLVALDAQRVAHRAYAVEPPRQGRHVGAVAQHRDAAEGAGSAAHRSHVDEHDAVADRKARARSGTGERGDHGRREGERGERAAHGIRGAEKPLGRGGAHAHDPCVVEGEHALVGALEHGGLGLHEGGELLRLHAEREALEAAAHEQRDERTDGDGQQHRNGDAGDEGGQVVEHARALEPDAHLSHRGTAGGRVHGHLGAGRLPQRAHFPRHDLAPGERVGEARADDLSEAVGVRMSETDAVVVGDDDEQTVGARGDVGGVLLQHPVAQSRGIRGARVGGVLRHQVSHLGRLGDRARDVQCRGVGLGLQLLHAEPREDRGAHGDDRDLRGDLDDEHPRGEPHAHLRPVRRPVRCRGRCAKCAEHTVRA